MSQNVTLLRILMVGVTGGICLRGNILFRVIAKSLTRLALGVLHS